ncbi:MAG: AI-2E family transporter, partial [Microcoleaceae cyanobacterium]
LLNFIPNLGPTLSIFPPMAIALLDSPLKSGLVLGLYIVIQQFEGNILTPYVMAQQVALLPAITLISQVFFATFFGFFGLLLALPLTVVAQVCLQEIVIKDILDPWQKRTGENHAIGLDELGLENTEEPQISATLPPKEDSENAKKNSVQVTEKSSEKPDDNQP